MSIERQPAKLATINLRKAIDAKLNGASNNVSTNTKVGLGSPSNRMNPKNNMGSDRGLSETEKVMEYMMTIRNAMSNTDKDMT